MKTPYVVLAALALLAFWAATACKSTPPPFEERVRANLGILTDFVGELVPDDARRQDALARMQDIDEAEQALFRTVREIDRAIYEVNKVYDSTRADFQRAIAGAQGRLADRRKVLLSSLAALRDTLTPDEWGQLHEQMTRVEIQ